MTAVRIGPWIVESRPEATRAAYARIALGGSEKCTCETCRNFAAARPRCYPRGVLDTLEALEIDPSKEVESAHCLRTPTGLHLYIVWFHFVGVLAAGGDHRDYEAVTPTTTWRVSERRDLLHAAFGTEPVLQLDLCIEIPWGISTPAPD